MSTGDPKVSIDRDQCLSSGKCVATAPGAFAFDDDELAVGLPGLADIDDALVTRLIRDCPSGALSRAEPDG